MFKILGVSDLKSFQFSLFLISLFVFLIWSTDLLLQYLGFSSCLKQCVVFYDKKKQNRRINNIKQEKFGPYADQKHCFTVPTSKFYGKF